MSAAVPAHWPPADGDDYRRWLILLGKLVPTETPGMMPLRCTYTDNVLRLDSAGRAMAARRIREGGVLAHPWSLGDEQVFAHWLRARGRE